MDKCIMCATPRSVQFSSLPSSYLPTRRIPGLPGYCPGLLALPTGTLLASSRAYAAVSRHTRPVSRCVAFGPGRHAAYRAGHDRRPVLSPGVDTLRAGTGNEHRQLTVGTFRRGAERELRQECVDSARSRSTDDGYWWRRGGAKLSQRVHFNAGHDARRAESVGCANGVGYTPQQVARATVGDCVVQHAHNSAGGNGHGGARTVRASKQPKTVTSSSSSWTATTPPCSSPALAYPKWNHLNAFIKPIPRILVYSLSKRNNWNQGDRRFWKSGWAYNTALIHQKLTVSLLVERAGNKFQVLKSHQRARDAHTATRLMKHKQIAFQTSETDENTHKIQSRNGDEAILRAKCAVLGVAWAVHA
ncbi:hypothetical protein C8R47DRAFT_1198224 [Mycena vitilis]|nr:hypothetical protein C8R47DRAFT_1198224 [Mycena vitilis]